MIQDKELLLKDLCARLPYGVKLHCISYTMTCIGPYTLDTIVLDRFCNENTEYVPFDEVKPYLFPLSSMTEEQKKTLKVLCDWNDEEADAQSILVLYQKHFVMKSDVIDWLHKNHFDYRGLIDKGLAIDATGLNIYKEETK